MPQTISLCMITKNEGRYLEQCLNSVKEIVDEIIIVDTGSTDKTKEIAKKFKAKIIDFKWIDDFSAARNESLKHATKDWILVRLFKNNLGLGFRHRVHELIEDSISEKKLEYQKLDAVLHHFGSLKDENLIGEKTEQYSGMILRQLEENPESARYNYQAARMHLGMGDFSNALKYFEKTAKLNPNYKLVFSEIAKIYLQMNDKNRAIEYFKKSMKYNAENPSPANNLAVVYMSIGKFGQARNILEGQLKKNPDNKALRYNYDEVLKNLKK